MSCLSLAKTQKLLDQFEYFLFLGRLKGLFKKKNWVRKLKVSDINFKGYDVHHVI